MTERIDLGELIASIEVEEWLDDQGIDYRKGAPGQLHLKECPFCGRSKWKVSMRSDDGRGRCYSASCAETWTLFKFARQHLQCDNRATVEHFKRHALGTPGKAADAPKSAPALPSPDEWKLPLSIALPLPSGQNHPFLTARKITPQTTQRYGLRYCHDGVYRYVDYESNSRLQEFSRRIVIPVKDLDGSMQTFQGRDTTGEAERRYLFPPLLPASGRFLYGGELVRGKRHLVLGEGPFDVMAIDQAIFGLPDWRHVGAVGTFGLSIGHGHETGDDQLGRFRQLKHEGLERVTFLWDAEPGALKQALKGAKLLRGEGFKVTIGLLPEGKDPNEVDTRVVRDAISAAAPYTEMLHLQWELRSPL